MSGEQLFRAIGSVDDDLVEEAEHKRPRPALRLAAIRWVAAAACLALVIGFGVSRLTVTPQLMPAETLLMEGRMLPDGGAEAGGGAMPFSSPAVMRKFLNYAGYRYAFLEDGAPYDFAEFELTHNLGALDRDILAGMGDGGINGIAEQDFATTFALGGTLYEIPGYDPAFRLAVALDGQIYLAELVGRVDNLPMGADYYCAVSDLEHMATKANILPHMGGDALRTLGRGDASRIARSLSGAEPVMLTNEDYEAVAREQTEGGSWQLELVLKDGTDLHMYVLPWLSLITIGDDYYALPEDFLRQYGDDFKELIQEAPPYA